MAAFTSIDNPELYFQVKTWSGNNSGSGISITLDGDEDMSPDLVWVKARENTHAHVLYDSVRTSPAKYLLQPNNDIAERTAAIGSFDSNGVTFSDNDGFYNGNETYVGWFWKETADAGLDIVTYTGNGTDDTDISHSLSAVPHWIVIKNRDQASGYNWRVYHHKNTSAPETDRLNLNDTNATHDDASYWSDEAPTSSVFTLGTDSSLNGNTDAHVAYLWSEKQGYSKFGSYIGNGNNNGTFVYLGFRPAWLLIKRSSASGTDWILHDNKRAGFNVNDDYLAANTSAVEVTGNTYQNLDLLANGFKMRGSGTGTNTSGETYVYMAFAEQPFVNSKGAPANAR
jgi:hypothetical protein